MSFQFQCLETGLPLVSVKPDLYTDISVFLISTRAFAITSPCLELTRVNCCSSELLFLLYYVTIPDYPSSRKILSAFLVEGVGLKKGERCHPALLCHLCGCYERELHSGCAYVV